MQHLWNYLYHMLDFHITALLLLLVICYWKVKLYKKKIICASFHKEKFFPCEQSNIPKGNTVRWVPDHQTFISGTWREGVCMSILLKMSWWILYPWPSAFWHHLWFSCSKHVLSIIYLHCQHCYLWSYLLSRHSPLFYFTSNSCPEQKHNSQFSFLNDNS